MSRARREQNRKNPQPPPIPVSERRSRGPIVEPLIHVDPNNLGPAMQVLNPAQRAFVHAKVFFGMSNADAARAAGYSTRSPHAADVHGCRLAHEQRIQAALLEEGGKLMRSEGPKSILTLVGIRDDKTAKNKDRLSAASQILDRSGFHAMTEHHVSVEHSLSDSEKDRRILALCQELDLSPLEAQKMLIAPSDAKANGPVIEAEFEEVRELTPAEIATNEKRDLENVRRNLRRAMSPEERKEADQKTRQEKRAAAKKKYWDAIEAAEFAKMLEGCVETSPELSGDEIGE